MRVPNLSIYDNAKYNLGGLTSDLQDTNEIMATQKRINSISDDPIGLSQVLNLKTSIGNLDQIEKNVNMGISWLKGTENSLDSVNNLILDAKTQVSRLINASMSASERKDAIGSINGIIDQIVALGNTQINGNYIFSGTDTDIPPLTLHNDDGSPKVLYDGNEDPFKIKTDKNVNVSVGQSGGNTFWYDTVEINSTNNTIIFKEDIGHGSGSEIVLNASIDQGEYTTRQLEQSIRNALNDASATDGYGVSYEVEYQENTRSFVIKEDGSYDGYIRTEFMWETGKYAYVTKINSSGSINLNDINIDVVHADALTIDTPLPKGSEPFRVVWQGDGVWEIENNPGYTIIPSTISGRDDSVSIDVNESGTADIKITLDTPVTRTGQYIEFDIVSAQGDHSIGHEIGFAEDNTIYAPPTSDDNAVFVTELIISPGVNDTIEFVEVNSTGGVSATLFADINLTALPVTYTDMDSLASVIETQMEAASVNGINYAVSYDVLESRFNIREDGSSLDELRVLWSNSAVASATGATLGFYPLDDTISYPVSDNTAQLNITINDTNNTIAFRETDGGGVPSGVLWARVASGTYASMADLEGAVETAMANASSTSGNAVTYDASYDDLTNRFSIQRSGGGVLNGLDLLWGTANSTENSIGEVLGYDLSNDVGGGLLAPYSGSSDMVLMTFDSTNNVIDFEEIAIDGTVSDEVSIMIPEGDYTDLDDVAEEIQDALRDSSPHNVDYIVEYDYASGAFTIKGSDADIKGFSLLWQTGPNRENSAADFLGFYDNDHVVYSESDEPVVNITIDSTNNKIDFREILKGSEYQDTEVLTASVEQKTYTSHSQLALEVEKALEEASYQEGNKINYSVSWDSYTKNFTVKENGSDLDRFELLWETGENAPASVGGNGGSIGTVLGFEAVDEIGEPTKSQRQVEWGIFNSLIDLNVYLEDNDTYGIERTLGRLESHFNSMTSQIVDIGIRYNRLEIRENITTETSLSLTERKSTIEDADFVEAIMDLQSIETAYQASLNSTAKIMSLSLVDFL